MDKTSKVIMTLTQSSGEWLNGCLQPQYHYVSLEIKDPEEKELVRVALSFEQAARMLLYNGEVECTLIRYRDLKGNMTSEKVNRPDTVHDRMKKRLREEFESLDKRIEDIRRDLHDLVNGDTKPNKKTLEELLHEVETVKSHYHSNRDFVLQQSEEELSKMQSNAAGQLSLFLQSKGFSVTDEESKKMLPISSSPLMIGNTKPVEDNYELKERVQKEIKDMTAMQVAELLNKVLHRIESKFPSSENKPLYMSSAIHVRNKVKICYTSYQSHTTIELDEAREYLEFLMSIKDVSEFKQHFHFKG